MVSIDSSWPNYLKFSLFVKKTAPVHLYELFGEHHFHGSVIRKGHAIGDFAVTASKPQS